MRGLCLLLASINIALAAQPTSRARLRPQIPIWTGLGETGPSSATSDVFLSSDRHQIIVLIPDSNGAKTIVRVPLWNDISPSLDVTIRSLESDRISYEYTIGNASKASDPIGTWAILIPSSLDAVAAIYSPRSEKRWGGAASTAAIFRQELLNSDEMGRPLRWYYHTEGSQIFPGEKLTGYRIESSLRPGFTTAWFAAGKVVRFDPAWPDKIFKQMELLEDKSLRGGILLAIGPMFEADAPIAEIKNNFSTGLRNLIAEGHLTEDSPFIVELSRMLHASSSESFDVKSISAKPNGPFERAILGAVEVSLAMGRHQK